MIKKIAAVMVLSLFLLATAASAFAEVPPGHKQKGGQKGYEGQPGNQSSGGH